MGDTKKYEGHLRGVGCDVVTCKYNNTDNCCTAGHIDVQNERAQQKGETYCSTFTPKGSV